MALPALPLAGVGVVISCVGLAQRDLTTGFSLLGLGLLLVVSGIIMAFITYKTDALRKANKEASASEDASAAS